MNRKCIPAALAAALALGSGLAAAQDYPRAAGDLDRTWRLERAPEWNPDAPEGHCRLRIFVDDKATVSLRGDQIVVRTRSGNRSYDQGSHCTQPLPFHAVNDFRVTAERGRGHITDVRAPHRGNDFTGSIAIADPDPAGETYVIDVAWNNPGAMPVQPLTANEPRIAFDEARACQERVRVDFLARNSDDAYLEFTELPARSQFAPNRERITGRAWARNRMESRPLRYECTVNDRTNRVIASGYEMLSERWNSALR